MDVITNLKNALMDVLQKQAGKIGENFVSDLSFGGEGKIVFSLVDGAIKISGKKISFRIMDKSKNNAIIFEVEIPVDASINIPNIEIPLNINGQFTK